MFEIKLMLNNSEPNRIDKKLDTIMSVQGTLKDETSIIDPIITIECNMSDVRNANYMHITAFNRYYFIRNIRSITNNLVEFTCHVDVLMSFRSEILANSAIIRKQENVWNLYLNDGSLRIYQNPNVLTRAFPSGFTHQEFVLAIAGSM